MSNGSNNWGVSYSRIAWLETIIKMHDNVKRLERYHDIVIEIERKKGSRIKLLCLDEYTLGEAGVSRVHQEFEGINLIFVGGNWNGYTAEAKILCLSKNIGLFNASELPGALWREDFWRYCQKDEEGNPIYPYK